MRIDLIIPVLDERARVAQQLRFVARLGLDRVVCVDGGSHDGTPDLVRELMAQDPNASATVELRVAPTGRGAQMNAGAACSDADVLLFCHCDVRLPLDARTHIETALRDPRVVAGAFRTRTVAERRTWNAPLLWLADLRSRVTRLPYGDQAIFVRRRVFEQLGGFADIPLFEDIDFCKRVRAHGDIARLPAEVVVSGRRMQNRPLYYLAALNLLPLAIRFGASPHTIARWYPHER